jgi:CO/xanthine dehydrogenase Mo-binding subunit
VIERGDSRRHLPWNLGQFGSNTSFTMARTNYVAAMDALTKLKEIAARDLGGSTRTTTKSAKSACSAPTARSA